MTADKKHFGVQELEKIIGREVRDKPVDRVILFGSRAQKTDDLYSDTDLLLVAETTRPFPERFKDFWGLIEQIPTPVEMLIYTPHEFERLKAEENPFIETVLEQGVVVYERSTQRSATMVGPS